MKPKGIKIKISANVSEFILLAEEAAQKAKELEIAIEKLNACEIKMGNCWERSPEYVIPEETLEWMERAGIKPFDKPQTHYCGVNHTYSTEYLISTPLEELKSKYDVTLIRTGEPATD